MREKKYLDLILETGKGIVNVEVNHGYKENKLEMARNMLKDGLDIETISKYTGLSKKEIENI